MSGLQSGLAGNIGYGAEQTDAPERALSSVVSRLRTLGNRSGHQVEALDNVVNRVFGNGPPTLAQSSGQIKSVPSGLLSALDEAINDIEAHFSALESSLRRLEGL